MTRSPWNAASQESMPLPRLVAQVTECIIIRSMSIVSLDELSMLRCCLPNLLQQLFDQIPTLAAHHVVDWIVEGIRTTRDG